MAKFKPDYVPSRGTGNGTSDDDRNIASELAGRVGRRRWGDLPESCEVVESDGKLKEISVPGEMPGTRKVIIVEKK